MENVYRNDALKFFESMTEKEQQRAIRYLQKIIKKPPEIKEAEKKSNIHSRNASCGCLRKWSSN